MNMFTWYVQYRQIQQLKADNYKKLASLSTTRFKIFSYLSKDNDLTFTYYPHRASKEGKSKTIKALLLTTEAPNALVPQSMSEL